MVALWLAWQLWKLRLWRSVQLAFLTATLIVAALAAYAWIAHQQDALNREKHSLTISLLVMPTDAKINVHGLADDLRILAPDLISHIEIVTDSVLAERLQSRYGIPLEDIAADSLLPTVLRVHFHPERLTVTSFTALVEQCRSISEFGEPQYSLAKATMLFQRQQELSWIQVAIASVWLIITLLSSWLHLRVVLPLDIRSRHTLELLSAPGGLSRRVRMFYACASTVLGIAIALVISVAVLILLPQTLPVEHGFYAIGSAVAGITVLVMLAMSGL